MDPQTNNPEITALTAITKMASTANPAAGFGIDFYVGESMPLIKQIRDAVESGDLKQPFTVQDLKIWIKKMNIVKDDGSEYAEASINAILSNSDTKNVPTTNKNVKTMNSMTNNGGNRAYWFE